VIILFLDLQDSEREMVKHMDLDWKRKEWIFKTIAIALPFLFLILVEVTLRLFNYGREYNLFIENEEYPEYLHLNPDITKKYFTLSKNATVGARESFLKDKPNNGFRIFVLGASTTVGFPYYHNGSLSRMLKYHLQIKNPDKHIEVINLSLTAVNTYTILDFVKKLPKYQPDLVILYTGHNEYYGALGVGSTSSLANNPAIARTYIELQRFRVFQLVINLVNQFRNVDPELVDLSKTLMRRMTGGKKIPYQSKLYNQGITQYRQNIDKILKTLDENEIPAIIGTLVSNLKDQRPLATQCKYEKSHEIAEKNKDSFNSFSGSKKQIQKLKAAVKKDSLCGELYYWLGKHQYFREAYGQAKKNFLMAKELDQLRFRAPSVFNGIIRKKAEKYNIPLADINKTFEGKSENGIIGEELMLEHVHPRLEGQYLMARTFYNKLKNTSEIQKDTSIVSEDFITYHELPLTRVDSLYGIYNTWILKEQWPFNQKMPEVKKENPSFEEKLAGNLAVNEITWGEAMNTLYKHYLKQNDYFKALEVTEWLILEFPYDLRFYERAGKLAEKIDSYNKTIFYYKRMFHYRPNNETAQNLFITYLKLDKPDEALTYINYVMNNGADNNKFGPLKDITLKLSDLKDNLIKNPDNVNVMLNIAHLYMKIGNYKAARKYLDKLEKAAKNEKQLEQYNSLVSEIPEKTSGS